MTDRHAPSRRHLNWEGCYNTRDLGGLPTAGGGQTRWGAVIRSDLLGRLTPAGRRTLRTYGVRTVIDLRGPQEVEAEPSLRLDPGDDREGITYLNLPLEKYDPQVSALISGAQSRAEAYAIVLASYPRAVLAVLRAIAEARPGGVVIHCHAGKDRTGIVTALLLALAGVSEEAIVADYAESQVRLRPLYEALVAEAGGEENVDFWLKPTATKEMMQTLLDHLRDRYGGVEDYLRQAGLTPDELEQLKSRLRMT